MPHLKSSDYPGQALACELYHEGGIRTSEIGSLMFGGKDKNDIDIFAHNELVRLAIPRRTYTQSHMDYVIEALGNVWNNRKMISGYTIIKESKTLRHFSAHFKPVAK